MLTVKVVYLDGKEDIRDCWSVDEICLDGVDYIKVIRNEKAAA